MSGLVDSSVWIDLLADRHRLQTAQGRFIPGAEPILVGDLVPVEVPQGTRTSTSARGITIRKTVDTLTAIRCILDGIPLLYSDRDYDPLVEHLGLPSALDHPGAS